MYKSLGYTPPEYIHMPVIVAPDRKKLSKRRGAVPILEYRDMGYLSEALFNFLVLIGWSLDDKTEIMSRAQIVENFSIERMGKTAAAFNQEKLDWMNGVYIRELPPEKLADMVMPFLEKWLPPEITRPLNTEYVKNIVPLIRERILTLKAAAEYAAFFFTDNMVYDVPMLLGKKTDAPTALKALKATDKALAPSAKSDRVAIPFISRKGRLFCRGAIAVM